MIDAERWAEARRLHRVEGYKVRAIARRLGLDPKTVRRALRQDSYPGVRPQNRRRGSILDAYREAIRRYVAEADLSAVQVHTRLVKEQHYKGEITLVRAFVRELRRSEAQAFLRLSFLPDECAQVDWAHFGRVPIGRTRRRVSAFVMVLAHSRLMYIELSLSERMDAFLEAHVRAFDYLGGVPKRCLYDNCKTVVLQRLGDGVRFHPRLLDLAGHYFFQVRACPPRRPWHKGRVESGIRYVRESFLRGRGPIEDIDRERRDLALWRDEVANERVHAVTRRRPRELFQAVERAALLPLPAKPYDTALVESVSAGKFYRVPFDGNLYSVPYQLAHRRGLVLRATTTEVTIHSEHELVARHTRSYDRGQDVIDPSHDRGLRAKRRRSDRHLLLGRMISVLGPEADRYAAGLAREHVRASHHVRRILALAERYGAQDVREALLRALSHEAFGADYIENVVHQERRRRLAGPAASAAVLHDADLAAIAIAEPDLSRFDNLFPKGHDHAGERKQPEGGEAPGHAEHP